MTRRAFASGELSVQHVAVLARAAEHIGGEAIKKAEGALLAMADRMDPGQFTGVVKNFEHQVDAQAALTEANRAHQRRYLHVVDQADGMVKLDGLLDAEGGAIVRNAVNAHLLPAKNDQRTAAQRRADALVEICEHQGPTARNEARAGSGPRPQLVIMASVETLAGSEHAPAGQIQDGGTLPSETVRRIACDAALIRITGKGELEGEISRASRTIPPAIRRALAARDGGCVAEHCTKPAKWTDAHHVKHWAHGGPTTMSNLILLCREHHRLVHEEGWTLRRLPTGRWALIPPERRSRSG